MAYSYYPAYALTVASLPLGPPSNVEGAPSDAMEMPGDLKRFEAEAEKVEQEEELEQKSPRLRNLLKEARMRVRSLHGQNVQALGALKEAQRLGFESDQKLQAALASWSLAEQRLGFEKDRADKLEGRFNDLKWQRASDASKLERATSELDELKKAMSMICDDSARADDSVQMKQVRRSKIEALLDEAAHLRGLLSASFEMDAKMHKLLEKKSSEMDALKSELEEARRYKDKLAESKAELEKLKKNVPSKSEFEKMKISLKDVQEQEERLSSKVDSLKSDLEKRRGYKDELTEREAELEKVKSELDKSKKSEAFKSHLSGVLVRRVEELEKKSSSIQKSLREELEKKDKSMKSMQEALDEQVPFFEYTVGLLEASCADNLRMKEKDLEGERRRSKKLVEDMKMLAAEIEGERKRSQELQRLVEDMKKKLARLVEDMKQKLAAEAKAGKTSADKLKMKEEDLEEERKRSQELQRQVEDMKKKLAEEAKAEKTSFAEKLKMMEEDLEGERKRSQELQRLVEDMKKLAKEEVKEKKQDAGEIEALSSEEEGYIWLGN